MLKTKSNIWIIVITLQLLITGLCISGCRNDESIITQNETTPVLFPTPTQVALPIFEPGKCKVKINTPYEHQCGTLTVLEDRGKPDGRVVNLPVVIFKSSNPNPAPDPLIYLPEGGGYSQLHNYDVLLEKFGEAALEKRDFIIFNQRGSELTMPHIFCADYDEFIWDTYQTGWSLLEFNLAVMSFWHTCYDSQTGRDLNLNMYTSADNAADANDLRLALGYSEANYYARSYGTRIGLNLIRDYPEDVRSLLLDSVYPPQVSYYGEHAQNAAQAFKALFETCANDAYCSQRYPNLEAVFYQTIDQLNLHPVRITFQRGPVLVTGNNFMEAIYSNLTSLDNIGHIPQMIYDAADNDFIALEPAILQNLKEPYRNLALFLTAQCREEIPFESYDSIIAQANGVPSQVTSVFGESYADFHYDFCDVWKVKASDPVENQAVHSGVPTLILAGQLDPISPPSWANQTAETLENAHYYEFPGQGHGVLGSNSCGLEISTSFLDDPTREPNTDCLLNPTLPDFDLHQAVPRFEPSGCYFNLTSSSYQTECGYLVVPEDRANPDGPTVKIHVVIFKSNNVNAAPDPVIYVAGGGGGNHLDTYDYYLENGGYQILRNRDYIMYNQRGAMYSHPALTCQGYSTLHRTLIQQPFTQKERDNRVNQFLLDCQEDLLNRGINLEHYSTATHAADLNDLRTTLGYEQVNLYGTSYGTVVILETMRDSPEGVRSAIIDSVYPPQINFYVDLPHNALRAFNAIFEDCAADPDCNAKYPDLEATFYQVVDELNADPILVGTIWVNGGDFMNAVFQALYKEYAIPEIPKWIDQASHGEHSGLLWYYQQSFDSEYGDLLALGAHYSILCRDEAPFNFAKDAARIAERLPPQIQDWWGWPHSDIKLCRSWQAGVADPIENQAVVSDIPTLILAGRYDPITPPAWGMLAAETLSHSTFFEFPALGHGVMRANDCAQEIGNQFLNDPNAELDGSCLAELSPPDFK
jgi:pimeloyl-ACP methyl ester carboxylesterase